MESGEKMETGKVFLILVLCSMEIANDIHFYSLFISNIKKLVSFFLLFIKIERQ